MSPEARYPTQIETELRFSHWLKKEGVKNILLDFDDTICRTRSIFKSKILQASLYLQKQFPQKHLEKWRQEINQVNDRLFEKHGVNPNRWHMLVEELSHQNPLNNEHKTEISQLFSSIYSTPPDFLPGAEDGLSFLKKINQPFAIVTHANQDWTWQKYRWLQLDRFLSWDNVYMIDENSHKTASSWRQAIDYFGITPSDCLVIGDSPRSDINPTKSIGVRHCVLVDDPNLWGIHRQEVPSDVKVIKQLSDLPHKIF